MSLNPPLDRRLLAESERHIRQLARSASSSPDVRDDLVQEAWLELLAQPPRDRGAIRTWLRRVIDHAAARIGRRERDRARREREVAVPDFVPSLEEVREREALHARVVAAVAGLNEPYRTVVRLRYLQDLTTEEVAAEVGRSPATVRSQLKRGLAQLRERMHDAVAERRGAGGLGLFALLGEFLRKGARARAMRWTASVGAVGVLILALGWLWLDRSDANVRAASPTNSSGASLALALAESDASRRDPVAGAAISEVPAVARPSAAAPAFVHGSVVDRISGTRVVGARILLAPADDPDAGTEVATSDALGEFSFQTASLPVYVWAEHDELAPTSQLRVERWFVEQGDPLQLTAFGGWQLLGTVVDSDGRRVAGAQVRVCSDVAPGSQPATLGAQRVEERQPPPISTTTDAAGCFRCAGQMTLRQGIEVRAKGCAPTLLWLDRDEHSIDVKLPRGATLAGRVTLPDGAPAARARVRLRVQGLWSYETLADSAGAFAFEDLAPSTFVLSAFAADLSSPLARVDSGSLEPGERRALDLVLDERSSIEVFARANGAPASAWRIEIREHTTVAAKRRLVERAELDPSGRAVFRELAGRSYDLLLLPPRPGEAIAHASREGVVPGAHVELDADGDARPSAFVAGRVVLDRSLVAAGTRLAMVGDMLAEPLLLDLDPMGRFRSPAVSPASYRLELRAEGYPAFLLVDDARLERRNTTDLGELAVPVPGALRVTVRAAGATEMFSVVRLVGMGLRINAHAAALGRGSDCDLARSQWSFDALWPGKYFLLAKGDGLVDESTEIEIAPGAEHSIELTARAGVRIGLRITSTMPLAQDDCVLVRVRTPEGVREISSGLTASPRDPEQAIRIYRGIPADALALEIQNTSGSLVGAIDFVRDPPFEQREYEVALAPPEARDPAPSARR